MRMTDPAHTTLDQRTEGSKPEPDTNHFWLGVVLLTLSQVGLRVWSAAGGWFYWDDFWWHDLVARNSIIDVATLSLGGHFSPLTYIPYYLLTQAAPFNWASRVVVMTVVLLLIDLAVLLISRRLWRSDGPRLTVYALWCLSTLAAPSWLWYSQFSMMGTLLLVSGWTLWAYLRAMQTRMTSHQLVALILLGLSLLAQERMLVMGVLLGAFLLIVVAPDARSELSANARLWLASAALLSCYYSVYRHFVSDPPGSALPSLGDGYAILWRLLATSGIPGLLGGPWVLDETPVLGRAGTTAALQVGAVVVVGLLVFWSSRANPRAWRAWLVLSLSLAIDALLVVLGRGATLGMDAIGEWRYFSDLAVLAPLLLTAAFVPPLTYPAVKALPLHGVRALVAGFVAGSMVTSIALGLRWHESQSRPFFTTALGHMRENPDVAVMDRMVPESVVNAVLGEQRYASRVFSSVIPTQRFEMASSQPFWIRDDGVLVPGRVAPVRRASTAGPCSYPLTGTTTVTVPLVGPDGPHVWGVQLDYTVDQRTDIVLRQWPSWTRVKLDAGSHRILIPLAGLGREVAMFLTDPSATGCVDALISGPGEPDQ